VANFSVVYDGELYSLLGLMHMQEQDKLKKANHGRQDKLRKANAHASHESRAKGRRFSGRPHGRNHPDLATRVKKRTE
jgi:hypothetical protein